MALERSTPELEVRPIEEQVTRDATGEATAAPGDGPQMSSSAMPQPEDLVLVERAREGDADAFGELVRLHTPRLYRLLTRMLGSATAAEDVAQECFIRAWRALPNFRAEARFSTWLYRIAVNEANRFLARESRRELLPYDDVLLEVPDLGAQTAELAEAGELRERLERRLAELPAHYRAATSRVSRTRRPRTSSSSTSATSRAVSIEGGWPFVACSRSSPATESLGAESGSIPSYALRLQWRMP